MFELDNPTPWAAGLYPGWSRDRQRQLTLVVKAGFSFDARGRLAPLALPPIEEADRYRGAADRSSLAAACETVPFKAGAELLLSGTARPLRPGNTGTEIEVGLRLSDGCYWKKTLAVFGERRWELSLLRPVVSAPQPLLNLPLCYEHAFGGCDRHDEKMVFSANPVGKGYSGKGWRLKGLELPQIESGPKFIASPGSRPQPAGFGPIAPFWEPRSRVSAALDLEAAARAGSPFAANAPADMYNAAPLDQRFDRPFSGGEALSLKGLIEGASAPEGVRLELPRLRPQLTLAAGETRQRLTAVCDTLLVDGDRRQLFLLFRAAIPFSLKAPAGGWVLVREPDAEVLP
ncbi:hypothetical protein DSOUD_3242 [Desulfuromonas soudanensis]|uniref:DUF2169 domain-containing protein n=1 Tax=Desulfuromonas soudanensis TaxID=1603606 RepID=A0A0M4DKC2_9BACT|nr:DUF2169 domain-containing protein [Desulfuromonas soudanensis]ALC17962.1 hypothetical protein DSOUD_3242 [Desulfuromonas soudanensis]